MHTENELMDNMTDYLEEAIEKIGRIDRRINNDPADGETFHYINRALVDPDKIESMRRACQRLLLVGTRLYERAHYWSVWHTELESRIKLDEDAEE